MTIRTNVLPVTLVATLAALLGACNAQQDQTVIARADTATEIQPGSTRLPAGTHCYFRDDESTTEALEITVTGAGAISGANYGIIHQEEEAYYASFTIELTEGEAGADGLVTFDSVTEVDGDTQTGPMVWTLSPDAAAPEGFLDQPLQPADCEGLEDRIFPPM